MVMGWNSRGINEGEPNNKMNEPASTMNLG